MNQLQFLHAEWPDVHARKRLRLLVKLIDKQKHKPIYTDSQDQMGDETAIT